MKYNISNVFNKSYLEIKAQTNSKPPFIISYYLTKTLCLAAFTS